MDSDYLEKFGIEKKKAQNVHANQVPEAARISHSSPKEMYKLHYKNSLAFPAIQREILKF